jgi:hypothetical protein
MTGRFGTNFGEILGPRRRPERMIVTAAESLIRREVAVKVNAIGPCP